MRKTIESLGIFWTFMDKDTGKSLGAKEVDGLLFYGYWRTGYFKGMIEDACSFMNIWDEGVELKIREWEGEENSNFSIEVRINKWPKECAWLSRIRKSLEWFTDRGAILSWCGTEYCGPSLRMFFPDGGGGNVYAAFSKEIGFFCGSRLYEEYNELDDLCLVSFYRALR